MREKAITFLIIIFLGLSHSVPGANLAGGPEKQSSPSNQPSPKLEVVTRGKITVRGKLRNFRLVVPKAPTPGRPVVFAFHGLGDSKELMSTYSGLDSLAAGLGFLVVYPDAQGKSWPLLEIRAGDDLAFFDALFQEIRRKYPVTGEKAFLVGMSNGAFFANLLAWCRPEVVAGLVLHSGGLGVVARKGIQAKVAFPVMIVHGTEDRIVPFSQGQKARDLYQEAGFPVEFIEVPGMGHRWAGQIGITEKIAAFIERNSPKK